MRHLEHPLEAVIVLGISQVVHRESYLQCRADGFPDKSPFTLEKPLSPRIPSTFLGLHLGNRKCREVITTSVRSESALNDLKLLIVTQLVELIQDIMEYLFSAFTYQNLFFIETLRQLFYTQLTCFPLCPNHTFIKYFISIGLT